MGFDLYSRMLAEAIDALKTIGTVKPRALRQVAPTIDLPLAAFIPRSYIAEAKIRLSFYQQLSRLSGITLDEIAREMVDRFGPLPAQVQNLLYVVRLRNLAAGSVIESIGTEGGQIVLMIKDGGLLDKTRFGGAFGEGVKIGTNTIQLDQMRLGPRWQKYLRSLLASLLREMPERRTKHQFRKC